MNKDEVLFDQAFKELNEEGYFTELETKVKGLRNTRKPVRQTHSAVSGRSMAYYACESSKKQNQK